jgi:PAS domain S-box-containing protein
MSTFKKPVPIDEEIILDPAKYIMSKTDPKGIIEYANEYFMEISEYDEFELMGKPHNIIRHPDMPQVIFKLMWARLHNGENIYALVKNLAKSGRYYWVLTSFKTKYDEEGNITSHHSYRKAAPVDAVRKIEKLYKVLRSIEYTQGMNMAERYFIGLLEEKGKTYDEFLLDILKIDEETIKQYFEVESMVFTNRKKFKRSFFSRFFGK